MLLAISGAANEVSLPLVQKADGEPITSGTVNFYLKAVSGDNDGKWYKGATTSWDAALQIAGAATHDDDGHWYLSLPTAVWTAGVRYKLLGKESGDLHIPVQRQVICIDGNALDGTTKELLQAAR